MSKLQKDIINRFIKAIDQVCTDKQFTVKELCKTISIHESTISVLRSGKPQSLKADILATFCLRYGYSLNWIVFGTGEMKGDNTTKSIEEEITHIRSILGDIILPLLNEVLKVEVKHTYKQKSAIKELLNNYKSKSN